MTGRELVSASLRLLGALAPGESLAAQEATDALSALNRMLDSWSNEGLLVYQNARDELTLVPGTASYSLGADGTFNTSRPIQILKALCRDESVSPAIEYPVNVLNLDQWTGVAQKDVEGTFVTDIYEDGAFPQRTLSVYPKPTAAHKLVLFSKKPLTQIATLDAAVSFPPGYEEAMVYNLAIRLAPEYGRMVSDPVVMIATESKTSIKRANIKPSYLQVDDALRGRGGAFNIKTGGA